MPLHPQVKQMLETIYASEWQDVCSLTPVTAREQAAKFSKLKKFPKTLPPSIETVDHYVPMSDGESILLRVYKPKAKADTVIVYFHGGGYVIGNVEQYDPVCRWLAHELETPVVSVEYRLAPEYVFPTQIEDGYNALKWIAANAASLGLNYKKLVVAGDSAGANLATLVCVLARDRKGPKIDLQWLLYPWTDIDVSRQTYQTYGEGYLLSMPAMKWFGNHYLGAKQPAEYSPFPMHITDLSNLPAAYIIAAECDVLHDEAVAYADKLRRAGNQVNYELAAGMIHGFLMQYHIPASFEASAIVINRFKEMLGDEF